MANRFWVGNSGTWDASTTTNWSATSNGAGGASAPTSSDDIFFDAYSFTSGSQVITIGTDAACKSMDFTGCTNSPDLAVAVDFYISGDITLVTGMTISGVGYTCVDASCSLTAAGRTIPYLYIASSGSLSLADNLQTIVIEDSGTFNTNGFNVTAEEFYTYGTAATLDGSTIIISGGLKYFGVYDGSVIIAIGTTINIPASGVFETCDSGATGLQNSITGSTGSKCTIALDAAATVGTVDNTTFTNVVVTGIILDATDSTNIDGSGNTGLMFASADVSITLPALVISSTINQIRNAFTVVLPALTADATIRPFGIRVAGTFPSLTAVGLFGGSIAGVLPSLECSTKIISGATITVGLTLPSLTVVVESVFNNLIDISLTLPSLTCAGKIFDIPVINVTVALPALSGQVSILVTNSTPYMLCLNTEINALTQYAGWNFNSMCSFNGEILCAGTNGILRHTGDKDNGVDISAYFKLFSTDLDIKQTKRIRKIFITGSLSGFMSVMSIFDNAEKTTYQIECPPTLEEIQAVVNTNYDDQGNLVGLKISNVAGSDFSIDVLTVLLTKLALRPRAHRVIIRSKITLPALEVA